MPGDVELTHYRGEGHRYDRRVAPEPEPFDLCRVEWKDAHGITGWVGLDDLSILPRIVVTVGVVIYSDDDHLVIAASHDTESNSVADVTAIPSECIRNIERLARPKPRR